MADPFIGEIRIFAGNFAPRSWTFCNGQTLPIAQNTALFSIIGTIYGGDGRTTLGLPNLAARVPMGSGNGPGLTPRNLGQSGGTSTETLTINKIPSHTHNLRASNSPAEASNPQGNMLARSVNGSLYHNGGTLVNMANTALLPAGGSGAHNNLQPYLVMNFIIALQGLYPSRN